MNAHHVDPKYDFRLPHVNFSLEPESSITDEPMIVGMFENVVFESWKDFDNEIESFFNDTSQLSNKRKAKIRAQLKSCIRRVNELPTDDSSSEEETEESTFRWQDVRFDPRLGPFAYYCCNNVSQDGASASSAGTSAVLSADRDPRQIRYGTSSSCVTINQAAFESIRVHLRAIFKGRAFNLTNRNYRLLGSFRTPKGQSVRKLGPVSDQSLVEIVNRTEQAPPICCFEMKSPKVDYVAATQKFFSLRFRTLRRSAAPSGSRLRNVDVADMREGCIHEISADEICLYFNYLFGDRGHNNSRGIADVIQRILMPISLTIVQALTTLSGFGFLFTHEHGIAFEVDSRDADGKIVIRTSRLFCCNMQRGTLAAASTLGWYAIRKCDKAKYSTATIQNIVKDLTQFVRDFDNGRPSSGTRLGNSNHVASTTNESAGANTGRGSDFNSATRSSGQVANFGFGGREVNEGQCGDKGTFADDSESIGSNVTFEYGREEAVLARIGEVKEQFLAEGASGLVMSFDLDGEKLVTKVWNGQTEKGLNSLRREIDVYHFVELHASFLLG